MEPAKPKCSNEFLWPAEFPGTLPALGTDGILPSAGEFHHRGSFRYPPIAATLVCVKSQRDVMSLLVHSINSACVIILVFFLLLFFLPFFRYRCWPCVLLSGGCFPQPARWWKVAEDPIYHVSL